MSSNSLKEAAKNALINLAAFSLTVLDIAMEFRVEGI